MPGSIAHTTLLRPRIKRTIETIEAPSGDLHLMRATASDVRIPSPSPEDRDLLSALSQGSSLVEDLTVRFDPDLVLETLQAMEGLGLLEDAADYERIDQADLDRLDRQLRYFSDISCGGPTPSECQALLRAANVVVLGVGGLGGRTALELACLGVGSLYLVDGDRVELSNLNRQIQ